MAEAPLNFLSNHEDDVVFFITHSVSRALAPPGALTGRETMHSDPGGAATGTDSDTTGLEETPGVWVRVTNLEGHRYYRHIPTGDTRWSVPTDGPVVQDWTMYRDEFGNCRLHHAATNATRDSIPCMRSAGDGTSGTASDRERDRQSLRWWKHDMKHSPRKWAVSGLGEVFTGVKSVLSKIGNYTMKKASGVRDLVTDMYVAERDVNAQFQAAMQEEAAEALEERRVLGLKRRAAEDELRRRRLFAAQRQGPPPAYPPPGQVAGSNGGGGGSADKTSRAPGQFTSPQNSRTPQYRRYHESSRNPDSHFYSPEKPNSGIEQQRSQGELGRYVHPVVPDGYSTSDTAASSGVEALRPRRLSYDFDATLPPPVPVDHGPPKSGELTERQPGVADGAAIAAPAGQATVDMMAAAWEAEAQRPLVLGWDRNDPHPSAVMNRSNQSPLTVDDSRFVASPPTHRSVGALVGEDSALFYSAPDTDAGGMSNAELEV